MAASEMNVGSSLECPTVAGPRVAFVTLQIFCIETINILEQTFVAEIFLNVSWRDEKVGNETTKFDPKSNWTPHIRIKNLREEKFRERWYRIDPPHGGKGMRVNQRTRLKATFNESFEMHKFPFDLQDLQVVLMSTSPIDDIVLSHRVDEFAKKASFFDLSGFLNGGAWECNGVIMFAPQISSAKLSASGMQYTELVGYTRMQRRHAYFVRQFMVPSFLITLTPAVTYWLPDFGEKLSVTLTMVLTMFAFRFAISSGLPVVSYSTFLDAYLQNGVFFLFAMILVNLVTSQEPRAAGWLDALAYACWLGYHAHVGFLVIRRFHDDDLARPSKAIEAWAEKQGVGTAAVLHRLRISLAPPTAAADSVSDSSTECGDADFFARKIKEHTSSTTGRLLCAPPAAPPAGFGFSGGSGAPVTKG